MNDRRKIDIKYSKALGDKLSKLESLLIKNVDPKKINKKDIDKAFKQSDFNKEESELIKEASIDGAIVGGASGNKASIRRVALTSTYGYDKRPLLKTLKDRNNSKLVYDEVKRQFTNSFNWSSAAKAVKDTDLIEGKIPRKLDLLAKKALDGQPIMASEFARQRKYINRLADGGAGYGRLRRDYGKLLNAIEKEMPKQIERSISRAVNQKIKYNSERIQRTETAYAYNQGFIDSALNDEDVGGIEHVLSASHPVTDICDYWSEADLYGLGKGIYPKGETPHIPHHPGCECSLEKVSVLRAPIKEYSRNDKNGIDYIKKLSLRDQRLILGVSGQKEFEKKGSVSLIKGYEEPKENKIRFS